MVSGNQDGQMMIQEEQDDDDGDMMIQNQNEEDEPQFQDDNDENLNNEAPDGAGYDEEYGDEDNQEQIINPQYQLEDIQERDQDGNLIQHNLNVNTHNAQMNDQHQYQMMMLAQ